MFCSDCGGELLAGATFCHRCGARVVPARSSISPGCWIALLVVVAGVVGLFVMGIVLAIAIPSLLRSRVSANEACAVNSLMTVAAAQTDYNNNSMPHTYAESLTVLGSGEKIGGLELLDPALSSGLKSGYTFWIGPGPETSGSIWTWSCAAWPVTYQTTGLRSFWVDESGTLRGGDVGGAVGTVSMPELD